MIENVKGKKAVTCDNCGDGFKADTWEEAQDTLKSEGWKTKREYGEWRHYCPECKGEI